MYVCVYINKKPMFVCVAQRHKSKKRKNCLTNFRIFLIFNYLIMLVLYVYYIIYIIYACIIYVLYI